MWLCYIVALLDGVYRWEGEAGLILRETQISNFLKILQILYGYLKPISFLIRVSNWMSEKCGFRKMIRANP
jgi:hypothetical protein